MSQAPLSLLCIEPRFPGRLGAVADWLVRKRGYRCSFFCTATEPRASWPTSVGRGLDVVPFRLGGVAREPGVPWPQILERGLCYAYGCWEELHARRPWPIDLVLGRSAGHGSTLFAPVAFPAAPVVNLFDYYCHAHEHDLAGEHEEDRPADYYHWRRSANAMDLLDLENGVRPWAPTAWQRDLYPAEYRSDFLVLHDGIDAANFTPRPGPRMIAGRLIPTEMKVVSFVARALDRLRGFDRFARLANALLTARSDVLCVAAGARTGQHALDLSFFGKDYSAHLFRAAPPPDATRFWLLEELSSEGVADLFRASDLHVYASRPYPVARSLLEAMASGRVVLAWDNAPVREIITAGRTGLLVHPNNEETALKQALAVLDDPGAHRPLGEAAAAMVRERYDRDVTLPQLAAWFEQLVQGRG
jgi:glycosyltransferase involved in cell wall biosynthesis